MTSRTAKFDVVMATDCRFPGGNTSSVVEEIEAQYRAGYRTGVLHMPSPILGKPRPFASKLRQVFEEGKAELVLGVERVEAGLLLARHPTVFSEPPRDLPRLVADNVLLAVNQVASDDRGVLPYYDVPHVHRQIERITGQEATWAPIGPRVRQSLEEHASAVPVLPWDWENVIDVAGWEVPRERFVSDRPVIGRHSRGHWTKWPDTKQDILAAYPADPRYSVRILGGLEAPSEILDRIPANWVDLPFDSVPPREFLGSIDFFVYFHHPGLIEAFGRVALEAMSAGAVVIGPPYLERLFGDACLYGTPADVRRYVDDMYGDWEAFAARSRAGVELARRRFSYETHVERVAKLIGEPPVSTGSPPAEPGGMVDRASRTSAARTSSGRRGTQRAQLAAGHRVKRTRTLVVDLRRETGGSELLPQVVDQVSVEGPGVTLVPAWRVGELETGEETAGLYRPGGGTSGGGAGAGGGPGKAGAVRGRGRSVTRVGPAGTSGSRAAEQQILVETLPWVLAELSAGDRSRYLERRVAGLIATYRPERIVFLDGDGRDARTPAGAPEAGLVDVLLVHRDTVASSGIDSAPEWKLPHGWAVSRLPARKTRATRPSRTWLARLRRKAPSSSRVWARRTMSSLRRRRLRVLERIAPSHGLMLFEVANAELSLPVRVAVTHPTPERLPIALLVVTDEDVEPAPTLRAVVERAQMTNAFRPALLAPPSWVDDALAFDVTVETLVPAAAWETVNGAGVAGAAGAAGAAGHDRDGWHRYVRRRVAETCQVIHPATVVFVHDTISPVGSSDQAGASSVVLDVLEASRTRRRA